MLRRPAGSLLALLALALAPAGAEAADVGRFTALTARMTIDRAGAVAAPLPGGRVLIAGGFKSGTGALKTAEVFDPAGPAFASLTGSMSIQRTRAAAAPLKDGRVLIAGGYPEPRTAEIFDPATGAFTPLTGHDMTRPRTGALAAPLPDGRVLVAGGEEAGSDATVEIFDPATSTFTAHPTPMGSARIDGRATPLADGRLLLTGGYGQNKVPQFTAEVFDPATGQFAYVGDMLARRARHVSAPLPDGRVLIAGGTDDTLRQLASAEVYDPVANRWDRVGGNSGEMTSVRHGGMAAPLADGRVLIAGGFEDVESQSSAEVFEGAPDPQLAGDADFGAQPVGTASAERTFTVTNASPATLDVGRVSVEGGDGDFAVSADGCTGAQLGQGQSCTVGVTFAPSDLGPRAARLAVLDNAPSRVQRIDLAGAGVPPLPFVVLQPSGGAAGPDLPGAAGRKRAHVACVIVKRTARRKLFCVAKPPTGQRITRFALRVVRAGRTVARGTARGPRMKLRARRSLRKGRYTLRASVTSSGRNVTATGSMVVR